MIPRGPVDGEDVGSSIHVSDCGLPDWDAEEVELVRDHEFPHSDPVSGTPEVVRQPPEGCIS